MNVSNDVLNLFYYIYFIGSNLRLWIHEPFTIKLQSTKKWVSIRKQLNPSTSWVYGPL